VTGTRTARHALHSPKTSGTRGAVGSRKARGTNAGTGATRGARAVAGAVKAARGAGGAVAAPETNLALMGQNKTTVIVQGRSGGGGRGEGGGGTTTVRQIENQTTHRTKHENRGKETQGDATVGTFFGVFFVHPPHSLFIILRFARVLDSSVGALEIDSVSVAFVVQLSGVRAVVVEIGFAPWFVEGCSVGTNLSQSYWIILTKFSFNIYPRVLPRPLPLVRCLRSCARKSPYSNIVTVFTMTRVNRLSHE